MSAHDLRKPSQANLNRVSGLEENIGYIFKDKALAVLSLTHASYGDGRRKVSDNEQLEFLGDRVLGLLTAERLYGMNLGNEGGMARRLNALVRKEACAKVARKIGLGKALLISPSEVKTGGRDKASIIGDACEAVLAAIYIDGGYDAAKTFYDRFWQDQIEEVTAVSAKDPKTILQESASAAGFGMPVYSVMERSGPDHDPSFKIEVEVSGLGIAQGDGKSKKDAERAAAIRILENWPNGG
jgi:ribonuclease-3